jgi:hypothetical protein
MEAIAGLPNSPFQLIVNFQIPGDPPVLYFIIFPLSVNTIMNTFLD